MPERIAPQAMPKRITPQAMSKRITMAALGRDCGVGFGTSGARGLVTAMTDRVCYAYGLAFAHIVERGLKPGDEKRIALGGDRRQSTPRIAAALATAFADAGWDVQWCGLLPTPALALHGFSHGRPSVMVTGSHIPEDRNGIKFHHPDRELLKRDEAELLGLEFELPDRFSPSGELRDPAALGPVFGDAKQAYLARYADAFGDAALRGLDIGVYGHSAVGRDLLCALLERLGAQTTRLGWSETFISVDTEAVSDRDAKLAKDWAAAHALDAIVSTDGDSDRPLLSDANGVWCRGDVVGMLCARALGVRHVVTPVSSSTAAERTGAFADVVRTRIGSPFVIEAMAELRGAGCSAVAGYEANGGFLLASDVQAPHGPLGRLPTRDAFIVIVALLALCNRTPTSVAQLVADLPARFTASDRLQNIDLDAAREMLSQLPRDPAPLAEANPSLGDATGVDTTDGVRATFASGDIVHLRPSGNAPELRCYAEADSAGRAKQLVQQTLAWARTWT